MRSLPNSAIFTPDSANADEVLARLRSALPPPPFDALAGLKGAFYGRQTLEALMDEEFRHGRYAVATRNGHSISTSSEGEQKKALLHHLLAQQPDYLVMEGVFDHLDQEAQRQITGILKAANDHTAIIQLFNRRQDLLVFSEQVFQFCDHRFMPYPTTGTAGQNAIAGAPDPALPGPLLPFHPVSPLIRLREVSVSYDGRCILNGISWTIEPGEFWQLKGPNGSGKTTLLSMICGDNPKAYGQNLLLFGYQKGSGESVWDIKKHIGYFSNYMLRRFDRRDTAEQMLVSGFLDSVGLYDNPGEQPLQIAKAWLRLLGIYQDRQKPFAEFPLHLQRLILIARAMVKHPPLLILDEPTSGLGDESAGLLVALINKIARESKTAIIYVSHRSEPGLNPGKIFELVPGETGSRGEISTPHLNAKP